MKKTRILTFCMLIFGQYLFAQRVKNAINLEIGGSGLMYSLAYERFMHKNISISFGTSFLAVHENQTEKNLRILSFPISTSGLFNIGQNKHFVELGLGIMNLTTNGDLIEHKGETNHYLNPYLKLGYRFMPNQKKWQYKILFTPFLSSKSSIHPTQQGFSLTGGSYQIWGGMAVGYRF